MHQPVRKRTLLAVRHHHVGKDRLLILLLTKIKKWENIGMFQPRNRLSLAFKEAHRVPDRLRIRVGSWISAHHLNRNLPTYDRIVDQEDLAHTSTSQFPRDLIPSILQAFEWHLPVPRSALSCAFAHAY